MAKSDDDTNGSKKRAATVEVDGVIDLTEDTEGRPTKRPVQDTILVVPPMTPRLDPFLNTIDTIQRECVIYLCCDEGSNGNDGKFITGMKKCADHCGADVHQHCFQNDGTRHISLWLGRLSNFQVASIQQVCEICNVAAKLPLSIQFEPGFNSWKAGNYIGLSTATTKELKAIMDSMESEHFSCRVPGSKLCCDHLSLYRKRGMWSAAKEINRVRTALSGHVWGNLDGISIRVKELGGPYDECKVLASVGMGGFGSELFAA